MRQSQSIIERILDTDQAGRWRGMDQEMEPIDLAAVKEELAGIESSLTLVDGRYEEREVSSRLDKDQLLDYIERHEAYLQEAELYTPVERLPVERDEELFLVEVYGTGESVTLDWEQESGGRYADTEYPDLLLYGAVR